MPGLGFDILLVFTVMVLAWLIFVGWVAGMILRGIWRGLRWMLGAAARRACMKRRRGDGARGFAAARKSAPGAILPAVWNAAGRGGAESPESRGLRNRRPDDEQSLSRRLAGRLDLVRRRGSGDLHKVAPEKIRRNEK